MELVETVLRLFSSAAETYEPMVTNANRRGCVSAMSTTATYHGLRPERCLGRYVRFALFMGRSLRAR